MPTDQRVGFDNGERIPPVEQVRQSSQRKANGVGCATWPDFPLHKKTELFAQKQILGRDGSCRPETQPHKGQRIQKNAEDCLNHVQKRWHESILLSP